MFYILGLICILLYYGICIAAVCVDGGFSRIKGLYKSFNMVSKVIFLVIVGLVVISVIFLVKQNRYIYYWDNAGYWNNSINRMNYMQDNSVKDIISTMISSINDDDYNIFLPTIIALPMKLFGCTYSRYVIINCVMFLIPSVMVQALLGVKIMEKTSCKINKTFLIALIVACIFPANYFAMLKGYIDVAILLPIGILLYLFWDYDFERISVSRNIAIAMMLVLAWVSRRYVIFFIIGYVIALILKGIIFFIQKKDIKLIKNLCINLLIIGGISLGILLIFFNKFVTHALFTDYGNMYSAYDTPLYNKFADLALSFGYIVFLVIIVAGILCIIKKQFVLNYFSILIMILAETIVFWRIQAMGVQHRQILNLPIYIFQIMILAILINIPTKKLVTKSTVFILIFIFGFEYYKSFVPFSSYCLTSEVFPMKYEPVQRNDIDVLEDLTQYLNEVSSQDGGKIYVTASGFLLNCDILRKIHMPYSNNAIPNLEQTADVDLRDGFPKAFLTSEYVVVTTPEQLHLPSGQEVVSYLNKNIQEQRSYIGIHYEKIKDFVIDEGIVVSIYKKISDYSKKDLQMIKEYFNTKYPDNTDIMGNRIQ